MSMLITPHIRKKTALLGLCMGVILCTIGICVFVYTSITSSAVGKGITGDVSERSGEFIAGEKGKGGTVWNEADLEGAIQVEKNTPFMRPCYTVNIPFLFIQTKVQRQSDPCILEGRIISPPAHLVIGASKYAGKFVEFSGIAHRNRNPNLYTKEQFEYTNDYIQEYVTYSEEEGTTAFLSMPPYVITVAFSGMSQAELLKTEDVQTLINTMKVILPISSPSSIPL